jgi:hypothetical protein
MGSDNKKQLREHLLQAEDALAESKAREPNVDNRDRLDFAQAAVQDALRWLNETGDAATIQAALEEVMIGDLDALAAQHIERVRSICRGH